MGDACRVDCVERPVGSLTIDPAGFDFGADADERIDILVVAVDPGRLALAAAEGALPEAQLIERLGGDDPSACQEYPDSEFARKYGGFV